MERRAWLKAAIAAVVVLYAAVSVWPYTEWRVRGWHVNGAEPMPDGGVRFQIPGIAFAKEAPDWVETAMRSHRLELSLSVRSFEPEQVGPARILTLSRSPYERNLTIAQQHADLVLRVRTTWTSPNGTIEGKPVARVAGVFLTDDWVDLGILVEPGRLRILVRGEPAAEEALAPCPLETWDPSHRLALGNEITGTRPWLGEIRRAVVRVGSRTENYAEASDLEFPPHFLLTGPPPKLVPIKDLNWDDAIKNVVLYLPLGVFLGFLLSRSGERRRRGAISAFLLVAAISASMEMLQFLFVPRRWPSVDDVIFNALGGGIGCVLSLWTEQRLAGVVRRGAHD